MMDYRLRNEKMHLTDVRLYNQGKKMWLFCNHGFLNYLIKTNIQENKYTIFGYKGKQVRDNIHSWDVANFIYQFFKSPKIASVYNLGGGYKNSISLIESINKIEKISGKKMNYEYLDKSRIGDHICYYSDLTKIKEDFPNWDIKYDLNMIFNDVYKNIITY